MKRVTGVLVAVFGDAGKHARAAVGTNALPLNASVELELVAELRTAPRDAGRENSTVL